MSINTLSGLALRDRRMNSFFQDNLPVGDTNHTGSPAVGRIVGGVCVTGAQTYANYDGVPFTFNTAGELKVDTEISVSGVEINNIKVYSTDGTTGNSVYGKADANGVVWTNAAQVGSTAIAVNTGALSDGTQRTTLATNDPAVVSLAIMDDWDATQDSTVSADGPQVMAEGKDFDGSALPNTVTEGNSVRPAASLTGIQYAMLTGEDGSSTPVVDHDAVIQNGLGVATVMQGMEAADFDGDALPNAVAEGDAVRPKASLQGVHYVMVVNEDGSTRPAFDSGTDSFKGFEISPIWNQHVEETLADVTNDTDGTTNIFVDMDGYSGINLQLILSGGSGTVTVTVEASLQDDGTAAASATYTDVTTDVFGSASFTASTILFDDAKVLGGAKFVKIKVVTATGGSNDADFTIYAKRVY